MTDAFRHLEWMRLARIWKWPVPMITVERPLPCTCGRVTMGTSAAYSQHAGCDFFGHTASGRAVLIEAKSLDRPKLPMKVAAGAKVAPGVKRHQLVTLLAAGAHGAHALVVWRRKDYVTLLSIGDLWHRVEDVPDSVPWDAQTAIPIGSLPGRLVAELQGI